ncbi:MAG TPA: hypothetical protein VEG25_05240 [Burkholderiales bacterium]|nr:hypothetical protein [Burkholderiales bacterium]
MFKTSIVKPGLVTASVLLLAAVLAANNAKAQPSAYADPQEQARNLVQLGEVSGFSPAIVTVKVIGTTQMNAQEQARNLIAGPGEGNSKGPAYVGAVMISTPAVDAQKQVAHVLSAPLPL